MVELNCDLHRQCSYPRKACWLFLVLFSCYPSCSRLARARYRTLPYLHFLLPLCTTLSTARTLTFIDFWELIFLMPSSSCHCKNYCPTHHHFYIELAHRFQAPSKRTLISFPRIQFFFLDSSFSRDCHQKHRCLMLQMQTIHLTIKHCYLFTTCLTLLSLIFYVLYFFCVFRVPF